LVDELHAPRDLSRNPLFQVMLIFQNHRFSKLELFDINSEPIEVDPATCKFDLTLSLAEREDKLVGFFEYSTDLFDHSTIERMTGHLQTLLEGIVVDPNLRVSSLPLITSSERIQLLVDWNSTESDYPRDFCIHELFEAQVEKTPEAIAIEFDGKQLNFRELNAEANQLAHLLQKLGIGAEKPVGICVERSLEMVVGLLGILKAGGAYLPLDPAYPRERLAFMMEDAQVSVLLTQAKLVEDRGWRMEDGDPRSSILDPRLQVLFVDRDRPLIAQQSEKNPLTEVNSNESAYVIYTSGSTGKPKGVQLSHRSVLNCLHSVRRHVELTENEVFLAVTTISFDIAALENFLPLTTGAKLVLASRDEALDGRQLLDRLTECGATAMQATPSAWKLLLDAGWRGNENFRILCGGEVLSRELANQLLSGGGSLWNLYGPTETTIWSTIAKVEPGESPVLIGRPIANTQIYILDSHLQPVPVGVYGELYVGGDGLARGYLNRAELTTERFVLNPFSNHSGSRLYRTGDLARYLPDGNIEFLGRVDNQVKIRGHRIELGEIESVLSQHPGVREALVVAQDDVTQREYGSENPKSEKRLVAYFVPTAGQPSTSELRDFLKRKFPEFMIPSFFISIEALPLTPNGKIDLKALPSPNGTRPDLAQGFIEPRTEIEELVAQVWREVLKLEKIGVHDNFFELGGHSLLATRVISRIRDLFHIDMPLRTVFQAPTIAGLARAVETAQQAGLQMVRTTILPVTREKPFLPSVAQEPLLRLERLFPKAHFFNIPAAYRLKGSLDVNALERSLNAVVERHEALRTTFPTLSGRQLQFIVSSLSMSFDRFDLEGLPESQRETEAKRLAGEEAEAPFDLARGPLLRLKLLRLNHEDHVLLVTMHHIISDGWSMIVFFRDLAAFYEAYVNGHDPSLPELPIQYADFSQWQRLALDEPFMQNQLVHWKRQLEGPLPRLEFFTDQPRVDALSFLMARKSVSIAGDVFESLKKVSQKEESTLFMTLLTALNILLYCHTGQEDMRVGTLVANRNRKETENLIGHFANSLIMRTKLSAASSFRQLGRQVRDIALTSYMNQDLPFEALVQSLERGKNLNRASLCQVMFIYQTAPLHPIELPGLTVSFFDEFKDSDEPDVTTTTFDLILMLKEKPGALTGYLNYKIDLFEGAAVNQILRQFYEILQRIISEPDLRVSELCSLGTNSC
jgi:amino acid adenylation domain-containing protein